MSKYVIELGEDAKAIQSISITSLGNVYVDSWYVENLEELNSDYINEHFGGLQEDAYQRGLDDAWEAARRVAFNPHIGGLSVEDLKKAFDCLVPQQVFKYYTAQQTIEKLEAYEEKQKADDEIKVGDEVKPFYTDITGLVTLIDGDTIYVLWRDGSSTSTLKLKEVVKTGRHFDIASILEDMKHD